MSTDKEAVKYYLKKIRKLPKGKYDIREVALDEISMISLYEDYILEEFTDEIEYLTARDIYYLNREILNTISFMESTYNNLIEYGEIIKPIIELENHYSTIKQSIKVIEKELSRVKFLSKIGNSIISNSIVVDSSPIRYLQLMGYLQEDRELTQSFYRKLAEED